MESKFTISEVFKTGWKTAKSQIWILAGLIIAYTILAVILQAFGIQANPDGTINASASQIIVTILSTIISLTFSLGYLKNVFQALDGNEPQFSAYGVQARKIFTYFIANLIYSIAVLIGIILFVIPGIYLILRLQFFTAAIIEEDAGIIESLKKSWEITRGETGKLFLLGLVSFLVLLVGIILCLVGVFFAIPVIGAMFCCAYRKLNTMKIAQEEVIQA